MEVEEDGRRKREQGGKRGEQTLVAWEVAFNEKNSHKQTLDFKVNERRKIQMKCDTPQRKAGMKRKMNTNTEKKDSGISECVVIEIYDNKM